MDITIKHDNQGVIVVLDGDKNTPEWNKQAHRLGGTKVREQCPTPNRTMWSFPLKQDTKVRAELGSHFGMWSVPDPTESQTINLRTELLTPRASRFINWTSREFGEVLSPEGRAIGSVFEEDTRRWKALDNRDEDMNPLVARGSYAYSAEEAAAVLLARWEVWAGKKV